jgi:hypothetical protein
MANFLIASASGVWLADSSRAESAGLEEERITALAAGFPPLDGKARSRLTGAFLRNGL